MNIKIGDAGIHTIRVTYEDKESIFPFYFRLTDIEHERIRWFLEEYRLLPIGANSRKAEEVIAFLETKGKELFELTLSDIVDVFNHENNVAFLQNLNIEIESNDPGFLAIPWEILFEPGKGYLVPRINALYRKTINLSPTRIPAESFQLPFRILLVICRPEMSDDIPINIVAKPIISALAKLGKTRIAFDVLRPPTFETFRNKVNSGKKYDVIHFDCHGTLKKIGKDKEEGYLQFEDINRKAVWVSGKQIASSITDEKTVIVMNACFSGNQSKNGFITSIAGELLQKNFETVIAMSYAVYADTVKIFAREFYGGILSGKSVLDSFCSSQKKINALKDQFPQMALDWMIPGIYLNNTVLKDHQPFLVDDNTKDIPDPSEQIFERDKQLLEIDRTLSVDDNVCVFLTGVIGEGKSYFIRNFSAWYLLSGGCNQVEAIPGSVLKSYLDILKSQPPAHTLIIWDQAEEFLEWINSAQDDKNSFYAFLQKIKDQKSKILVSGRTPVRMKFQEWISVIKLPDLPNHVVGEAFGKLLQDASVKKKWSDLELQSIIYETGWHGGTLSQVLPLFTALEPVKLISLLRDEFPGEQLILDCSEILKVFNDLPEEVKNTLPLIGLFHSTINSQVISVLTEGKIDNYFFSIYHKHIDDQEWKKFLVMAENAGLLRSLTKTIFEIPSLVRYFLRSKLAETFAVTIPELKKAFVQLYSVSAPIWFKQMISSNSGNESGIFAEDTNLESAVNYAIDTEMWNEAIQIAGILVDYIEQKLRGESIIDRLIYNFKRRAEGRPASAGKQKMNIFLDIQKADLFTSTGHLSMATQLLTTLRKQVEQEDNTIFFEQKVTILEKLCHIDITSRKLKSADLYLEDLKLLLQDGSFKGSPYDSIEDLQAWYDLSAFNYKQAFSRFKILAEKSEISDNLITACTYYHQAALAAEELHQFDEALKLLFRSLGYRQRNRLIKYLHTDKFHIGIVYEKKGEFETAKKWLLSSLNDCINHKLTSSAGRSAHRLALVHEQCGEFDDAIHWLEWALPKFEDTGSQLEIGHVYYELAIIYYQRNELNAARENTDQAFKIYKECDVPKYTAGAIMILATICDKEGQTENARQLFKEAVETYKSANDSISMIVALMNLGSVETGDKKYDEATKVLKRGFIISSQNDFIYISEIIQNITELINETGESRFFLIWNSTEPEYFRFADLNSLNTFITKLIK